MLVNRPILIYIIFITLLFTCKKRPATINIKPITLNFCSSYPAPERLNGRVKRLITVMQSLVGIFSPIDTTYFDKKGNTTISTGNGRFGKILEKVTSKYNKNGQKLNSTVKIYEYAFGGIDDSSTSVFKYNDSGYISSLKRYYSEPQGYIDSVLYKYNKTGDLVEINNGIITDLKYVHHLLTEDTMYYPPKGLKTEFSFSRNTYKYLSFDKKGNWTKRIEYLGKEKYWMVSREITYY
jgi:hypothetical protein